MRRSLTSNCAIRRGFIGNPRLFARFEEALLFDKDNGDANAILKAGEAAMGPDYLPILKEIREMRNTTVDLCRDNKIGFYLAAVGEDALYSLLSNSFGAEFSKDAPCPPPGTLYPERVGNVLRSAYVDEYVLSTFMDEGVLEGVSTCIPYGKTLEEHVRDLLGGPTADEIPGVLAAIFDAVHDRRATSWLADSMKLPRPPAPRMLTASFAIRNGFMKNSDNWKRFDKSLLLRGSKEALATVHRAGRDALGPEYGKIMMALYDEIKIETETRPMYEKIAVAMDVVGPERLLRLLVGLFGKDFTATVPDMPGLAGVALTEDEIEELAGVSSIDTKELWYFFSEGVLECSLPHKFPAFDPDAHPIDVLAGLLGGPDPEDAAHWLFRIFDAKCNDAAKTILLRRYRAE